ncbi:MAG TPA: hypothetical protein VEY71_04290 [Chitinophagales bacterium]|nr:hypothetical protein [Chitinophagales bacterium]
MKHKDGNGVSRTCTVKSNTNTLRWNGPACACVVVREQRKAVTGWTVRKMTLAETSVHLYNGTRHLKWIVAPKRLKKNIF